VRATTVQVINVVALGVQCIGGDHHAGQVQAGQGVDQRRERGDLVGLALDVDLARTTRVCWSITASRCRAGSLPPSWSVRREPRKVLPSTASTRRRPSGALLVHRPWTKAPITASRSASTRPSSLRIVDSDGHRPSVPSAAATSTGRSATHSPTATNDRAPAATAHTAAVSTTTSPRAEPRGAYADQPPRSAPPSGPRRAPPDPVSRPHPPGQ
jgi:hypothetical protein